MFDKELIKNIRTNLNLTQKEFADCLGTHQQTIASIETGKRNVPKSMIAYLRKMYNIDYYKNGKTGKEHEYKINLTLYTNSCKRDTLKQFINCFDGIEAIEIQEVKIVQ